MSHIYLWELIPLSLTGTLNTSCKKITTYKCTAFTILSLLLIKTKTEPPECYKEGEKYPPYTLQSCPKGKIPLWLSIVINQTHGLLEKMVYETKAPLDFWEANTTERLLHAHPF